MEVDSGGAMLFVGDDWAKDHHDVEIVDDTGRVLARRRLPEGPGGITRLHMCWLRSCGWTGDDRTPDPRVQSTRAVTIDAPAEQVWPWLMQMGIGPRRFLHPRLGGAAQPHRVPELPQGDTTIATGAVIETTESSSTDRVCWCCSA
jgi:hypothetical protein